MADCTYTYDDKEFSSIDELHKHLIAEQANKPVPAEVSQQQVVDVIKELGKKINFVDRKVNDQGELVEAHDYKYGDTDLTPVSHKIEDIYPYKGTAPGEAGKLANSEGTKFHNTAEVVINALNKGNSKDSILSSISEDHQKEWAKKVFEMYDEWSDGGKNVILTEFRIGNVRKELAGTVDVAVVYPDGSIMIYDFKGTKSKYLSDKEHVKQKRSNNNLQINLYKRMLEVGDSELGLPPLKVRGGALIPIEFDIEEDSKVLKGFNVLSPVDIKNKKYFERHNIHEGLVSTIIPMEGAKIVENPIKSSQLLQWNDFVTTHTGFELQSASFTKGIDRMMMAAKPDENGNYYTTYGKGTKIEFQDEVARRDPGPLGRAARKAELTRDHSEMLEKRYNGDAEDLVSFINTGLPVNIEQTPGNADYESVRKLAKVYQHKIDHAILAKNIPGLEQVGGDTVVVMKGYDRFSGSYHSIDIITMDSDPSINEVDKLDRGTTIAGNYIKDSQAGIAAQKAGVHGVKLWKNTKANAHLLKMGLITMHLKQSNPDLVVSDLKVGSIGQGSIPPQIGYNVKDVLQQINILAKVTDREGLTVSNMAYGVENGINKLLNDKTLLDYNSYKGNNLESYLRLVGVSLKQNAPRNSDIRVKYNDLLQWTVLGDNQKLLGGIFSDKGIKATINAVDNNEDINKSMYEALVQRQRWIESNSSKAGDQTYLNNPEYQYLSRAILEMEGITDQFSDLKSLGYHTKNLITPGMSGIGVVDQFMGYLQRQIGDMNRRIMAEFMNESTRRHKELIADMKARGKVIGNQAHTVFLPMMEHVTVPLHSNPNKTVSRPTGRFWPKGGPEYTNLSKVQQEYIDWYSDMVYESMKKGLRGDQLANFEKHWEKGMIPIVTPSSDTYFGMMLGNDGEGGFMDKANAYFKRVVDPYSSKNDYIEAMSDNFETLVDKFEPQKKFTGEVIPTYGDIDRMSRLGFTADGFAKSHYKKIGDESGKERMIVANMETNLESVLALTVMNSYRMDYLSEAVDKYKAVKAVLVAMNSSKYKDNSTALEYLQTYIDKNLYQKNQINKENETVAKVFQGAKIGVNFMLLDYNLLSQTKNGIAGMFHTLSTAVADPSLGKYIMKGYAHAANPKKAELRDAIMWSMGLANIDSDQIVSGVHTQVTKRGFANSHYKNIVNYAGDYYYRSVFMFAQMEKDGILDAMVKNDSPNGPGYTYDETKDKRFKGPAGEAFKKRLKEELAKEGKLSPDGKMLTPYSAREIRNLKDMANEAFEAQDNEVQENFRSQLAGILFGHFRSWWLQKVKRYTMNGVKAESREFLKVNEVKREDGTIEYVADYETTYMEGIFHTVAGLARSIKAAYDVKNPDQIKDYFMTMSDHQKQNIRRLLGDFAMLAGMMMGGALIFDDDDDKNSVWYYLWYQSAFEISLWSHLNATPILGNNAEVPTISFIHKVLDSPIKTLTTPGFSKPIYYLFGSED